MSILPANATARAPWLALLLATAALVAWPVDARGAAASGRDRPVSPPVLTDDALDSRWSALLRREPGSDAEAAAFAELEVAALELGYVELPTHALLLVQLADEAIRTGDPVAARRYLDWAARIAPRSAQPHFLDARIAWSASKADVGGVGARLERAYRVLGQSLAGDVAVRMQGRRVLGATGAGLALLFCVAMLVRHGSRVSHDLRLLSARTVSLTQASAAVVLLSLAPAVITGSPLAFVATAIALTAAYLTVRERVVALCVLAACAAAPRFAADYAGLVSAVEPGAARAVSAVLSPCDARCVALLREAHEREGDGVAGLAIAWTQFRRGTPDQRRRAVELLDGLELEGAARASALGLRGSLAFVDGDLDAAEQSFRAAYDLCTTRGQRGAVLFDLYRVHRALGHTEAAETALQGALSEAPHQLEALRDYRGRSQNGVLAAVPIPADYVADRIRAGTSPERVELAATQLLSTWYGGVSPRVAQVLLLGSLLLVAAGWAFQRARWVSIRCEQCATPVSRFILAKAYSNRRCVLCYQLDVGRRELSAEQIEARELRVSRWRLVAPSLALAADILAPGVGGMVAGRTLRGALALSVWVLAIAVLAVGSLGWLPNSLSPDRLFDGRREASVALLIVCYGLVVARGSASLLRRGKEAR